MPLGCGIGDDVGGLTVSDKVVFEETRDIVFLNIDNKPHMVSETGPVVGNKNAPSARRCSLTTYVKSHWPAKP